MPSAQRIQRQTKRRSASRPGGACSEDDVEAFASVKAKSGTWTYSHLSRISSELVPESVVRDDVVLISHPGHVQETLERRKKERGHNFGKRKRTFKYIEMPFFQKRGKDTVSKTSMRT